MSSKIVPLFPGCEAIADKQKRQIYSSANFLAYLRERLEANEDEKGKVAIRLHIDATGKVDSHEFHPKSHPALTERVKRVICQMQEEDFRWIPGRENGEAAASTLEFMLNFGTTCQDSM